MAASSLRTEPRSRRRCGSQLRETTTKPRRRRSAPPRRMTCSLAGPAQSSMISTLQEISMSLRSCLPLAALALCACATTPEPQTPAITAVDVPMVSLRAEPDPAARLEQYVTVRLTADISRLSENERRMLPLLIDAAGAMDEIFWMQAFGNRDSLLRALDDA